MTTADLPAPDYEPFDQEARLPAPPWKDTPTLRAWEAAHGHDVRLKCYPEFGCLVVEPDQERRLEQARGIACQLEGEVARLTADRNRLRQLVKELDGLLACYRTGTNPGARLDRIAALRRALTAEPAPAPADPHACDKGCGDECRYAAPADPAPGRQA